MKITDKRPPCLALGDVNIGVTVGLFSVCLSYGEHGPKRLCCGVNRQGQGFTRWHLLVTSLKSTGTAHFYFSASGSKHHVLASLQLLSLLHSCICSPVQRIQREPKTAYTFEERKKLH